MSDRPIDPKYVGATQTRAGADALGRKLLEGQILIDDINPDVKDWRLDSTIREMVKTGDLHKDQFLDELERRNEVGPNARPRAFEDKHPWVPTENGIVVPHGAQVDKRGYVVEDHGEHGSTD